MTPEQLHQAHYWANYDVPPDPTTGFRVANLACMDWRGEYLRRTLEFIDELLNDAELLRLRGQVVELQEQCSKYRVEQLATEHDHAVEVAELLKERDEARAAEARRIHNWHDALVNEQMLVGVLRQQLAECDALRTARDEACDCLEALDNKFGLSMKVQLQIEAWRAVGKEAK